jgi:hypothetical protein
MRQPERRVQASNLPNLVQPLPNLAKPSGAGIRPTCPTSNLYARKAVELVCCVSYVHTG